MLLMLDTHHDKTCTLETLLMVLQKTQRGLLRHGAIIEHHGTPGSGYKGNFGENPSPEPSEADADSVVDPSGLDWMYEGEIRESRSVKVRPWPPTPDHPRCHALPMIRSSYQHRCAKTLTTSTRRWRTWRRRITQSPRTRAQSRFRIWARTRCGARSPQVRWSRCLSLHRGPTLPALLKAC